MGGEKNFKKLFAKKKKKLLRSLVSKMSCFMSLCLSIWVVLMMPGRTSALNDNITVMVMLPLNNTYLFSYPRVSPAIEYARKTLESVEPFAGLKFNVRYENSACGVDALYALVDTQGDERPNLVLGPVCEYAAAQVTRVASHWNIPVISAGALATGFRLKNSETSEYSHLTRIAPTYLKMAETFQAIFKKFAWRTAYLIYDDDKDERNCYFTMEGVYMALSDYHIVTDFAVLNSQEERVDADGIITSVYGSEGNVTRSLVRHLPNALRQAVLTFIPQDKPVYIWFLYFISYKCLI